ncbi:MAG: anti-sigma F factor [Candidatus Limiplasma sp.]|nr:anti-sigma F factor [Candidatus Limiplasma sp.]
MNNLMELNFLACPQNESFARVAVAAFAVQLSPTLPEMADIKTAVSEAVTNAIIHGYRNWPEGKACLVYLRAEYDQRHVLTVSVRDEGCGIADVKQAMQPFYSTGEGNERSGMGFCVMQTFMDAVDVDSAPGRGTTVTMRKYILGEVGLRQERILDEIG